MMGPIISARQLGIVEELVDSAREEGATILCGGARMTGASELDGTDLSLGFARCFVSREFGADGAGAGSSTPRR